MLETTLVALQDISLDTVLDDNSRKALYAEFPKIMQEVSHFLNNFLPTLLSTLLQGLSETLLLLQGFAYLPAGVGSSSMGRPISYEQIIAWKVLNDADSPYCLAFMIVNWSFM